VFSPKNVVSVIAFQTTSGFADASGLSRTGDYLLWYANSREELFFNTLFEVQETAPGSLSASWVQMKEGWYRGVRAAEESGEASLPNGARLYMPGDLQSQGAAKEPQPSTSTVRPTFPARTATGRPTIPRG
jgi:adenine-specific DNA-methyltransferase